MLIGGAIVIEIGSWIEVMLLLGTSCCAGVRKGCKVVWGRGTYATAITTLSTSRMNNPSNILNESLLDTYLVL